MRDRSWPTDHALRSWAFAALVLWAVVGAGLVIRGLGEVLNVLTQSLGPFLVAGLLVTMVRPISKRLKAAGMSDGFSALIGTLVALIGIVALTAMFAGPVISGAVGFFTALPDTVANLSTQLASYVKEYSKLSPALRTQIETVLQAFGNWAAGVAGNAVTWAFSGLSSMFSAGLSIFMGLILTFWFLKDGPKIAQGVLHVVPESLRDDVSLVGKSFDTSFSGYLVATLINVLAIFILDGLGFSAIHLPYAWFIALMIGVVGIIPYVGSIISAVIAVLVGLTVGLQVGVITGVIVFAVDQVVYSVLGPMVAGKVVTLHPVAIILALAIGASLGGFLGVILAMPLAAAMRTIYCFYRDKRAAERVVFAHAEPTPEEV
jgi:predicted PurR-regulated permease PerM